MTVQELYSNIGGNYQEASKRLMNDSLISRFIVKFLTDTSYEKLTEAVGNNDEKGIFEASHALKGVTANLAITSIAEIAGAVTEAYRPGNEAQRATFDLAGNMSRLAEVYDRAVAEIKSFSGK